MLQNSNHFTLVMQNKLDSIVPVGICKAINMQFGLICELRGLQIFKLPEVADPSKIEKHDYACLISNFRCIILTHTYSNHTYHIIH